MKECTPAPAAEPGTVEDLQQAVKALMFADRRLRARDRKHDDGLSHSQVRALFTLRMHEEVTAGQLAKMADLAPASVTALLDQLETDGIVDRHRSTTDRRVVVVSLTERGHELVEAKRRRWLSLWREQLGDIASEDIATAAEVVRRVAAMMDEA